MIQLRHPSVTPVQTWLPRSSPKQKSLTPSCLSARSTPLLPRAYQPGPEAAWPLVVHAPSLAHRALVSCRTMPHRRAPHCRPCRTPVLNVVPLAPSMSVRPSPIAIAHAADPTIATGVHVPWRLMSSSTEPRAPTSTRGASGAHASPLATGSDPDDWN
jgi:hypothetical protein